MAFVTFTGLYGQTILVNTSDTEIAELTAIPTASLPGVVANGTNIDYDDGRRIQVQGTPAATAATLSGGGVAPSNAVYVDLAGNNATGQRGNAAFPFLTMAAAIAAALSGDEVIVSPGTYSGAFTANLANLTIRGSGETAGATVLTAANGIDVCTLGAACRSILIDNISIVGATTGRAIVGTGATAARAWLSTGLVLQDCAISSAAGNALDLTYAGFVEAVDTFISAGGLSFAVCSTVLLSDVTASSSTLFTSYDETDALRPTAGQGVTFLSGSTVGATTIGSPTLAGGCPKLEVDQNSKIGALTGLGTTALGDNAAAHLSIIVRGQVGAVDFQSAAAKQLPDTATALALDFQGAVLNGSGASAMMFKVGGAAANAQIVHAEGLLSKIASTFTADVKVSLIMKGAGLFTPTYATPGATGDILPPYLSGVVDIAVGGALAKTWANLGHASLVRVTSTNYSAVVTSNIQGADAVVPIADKVATGLTITSSPQPGNTAANVIVTWNV